jgi:hypothetical protein
VRGSRTAYRNPRIEAFELCLAGGIRDAPSVIGVFRAAEHLRRRAAGPGR